MYHLPSSNSLLLNGKVRSRSFLVTRDPEIGGNQSIIVHYHDCIRNLERESSHGEVLDAADNADRTSIVYDSYLP